MFAGRNSCTDQNEAYLERLVVPIKQRIRGLFSALPGLGGGVLNLQSALLALSKPALIIINPLDAPPECMPQKCSGKSVPGLCMEYIFGIIQKGAIFRKNLLAVQLCICTERRTEQISVLYKDYIMCLCLS